VTLVFRPARVDEIEPAEALVVASINDLTERHGFGAMATSRPAQFQLFSLNDDPDGLWIAEEDGRILGFAFSWVCGDLWFLAELFVAPDQQGRGIGNELLKRTFEHAQKAGATTHALIAIAFNRVSQGLYIRHGLYPRLPVYSFSIAREALLGRLQRTPLRCVPIEDTASHLQSLAQIDAQALGVSRAKHHRFLIDGGAAKGFLLYEADDCVGYVYVVDGHIGPLAVARPDAMGAAFRTALDLAAQGGSAQVSAFLPGVNDAALRVAAGHGMRLVFPMVLMSNRDFGDWTRYLPRNAGFM
jgi:ribosomal protein S18 acetylase RimI-like enzyme